MRGPEKFKGIFRKIVFKATNSVQFLFYSEPHLRQRKHNTYLCTVHNNEIMLRCFHDIISCLLN